jgi:hypothetical protein
LWVKILIFFDAGHGIRDGENLDPGWKKLGSGLEKTRIRDSWSGINIPDPQHCRKHQRIDFSLSHRDVFPKSYNKGKQFTLNRFVTKIFFCKERNITHNGKWERKATWNL